jgi:hypothetical protein
MRWALVAAVCFSLSGAQPLRQPQGGAAPAPVPVVVELFTSEGCSSCPPADQLLTRLAKDQPVPGVQVIPLGMHVTYWDQLGWKDAAALKSATDRQQVYGAIWGGDRVYTPQAVVDGHEELVGSNEAGVTRAIAKAAKEPHARLSFAAALDGDEAMTTLAVTDVPNQVKEPLGVIFFVTEDGLSSVVTRGENGGRTLRHDAVVRYERYWGGAPGAAPGKVTLRGMRREWNRDRLTAVVVLVGSKSHRIYGAAATPLK